MPGIVLRIVILRSAADQVSSIRKEHLIALSFFATLRINLLASSFASGQNDCPRTEGLAH